MQVLKFGGTSVANAENINRVISIVKNATGRDKTVLVASAIGGCTDMLIKIGKLAESGDKSYIRLTDELENRHIEIITELFTPDFQDRILHKIATLFEELRDIYKGVYLVKESSRSSMDLIMSFGELLSTSIIAEKFSMLGISSKWIDARTLIKTEFRQSQNVVLTDETFANIRKMIDGNNCKLYIVPGFIASDTTGHTTTLGRGGSDYTASLIAVGTEARILEIWTDVDGMMTSDPRIVPDAKTIDHISYKEALELSHFGAKVVYPPTIQPVINKGIPILIKNSFSPESSGTLIEKNPPEGKNKIKGISGSGRIAILSMEGSGMVGIPGYSSRLFDVLTRNDINIILITQASSVHTMLVAIEEADADNAKRAVDERFAYEISLNKIEPLQVEKGYSIISLVGDDMKNQSGAGGRMFEAIGSKGINIRAIAQGSSEKNVSAVVLTEDFEEAVRAIHNEFFGITNRQLNLFICGYGNVGRALVKMVEKQKRSLSERDGTDINIVGVCDISKMVFNANGLDVKTIDNAMAEKGKNNYTAQLFIDNIVELSRKNSSFVDCTSDPHIATLYGHILSEKINVVVCNKIANTMGIQYYNEIRSIAKKEGVSFLYETNAGAALPVISTIGQIIRSGDQIYKIEATLSGTLNYLFNTYNGTEHFASIVRQAQEAGYTEPDPRTDLKGVDVLRKALILAREIGMQIEIDDIENPPFLPEECLEGSREDFYASLEKNEPYFKRLYDQAAENGKKLVYIIDIGNGKVKTGLSCVEREHPFYSLRGTDNAIILTTDYYPDGLRIIGAGAGALQTASGVLNDILNAV